MKKEELYLKVMEVLKELDDCDLVAVWSEYCRETNGYDYEIYSMDIFTEIYSESDPLEIATRCFYGHDEYNDESSFNPNRDYFYFNGYGNPVSVDYVGFNEYSGRFMCDRIDERALCDYITENEESFYNSDLATVLDEYENDTEEN